MASKNQPTTGISNINTFQWMAYCCGLVKFLALSEGARTFATQRGRPIRGIHMGWSIRRRKGLLGGLVNVNLSKSGLGISVGVKGARVRVMPKGQTYSQVSIPGTGIYNRSYRANIADHAQQGVDASLRSGSSIGRTILWTVVVGLIEFVALVLIVAKS